jgi:hypothetical protein
MKNASGIDFLSATATTWRPQRRRSTFVNRLSDAIGTTTGPFKETTPGQLGSSAEKRCHRLLYGQCSVSGKAGTLATGLEPRLHNSEHTSGSLFGQPRRAKLHKAVVYRPGSDWRYIYIDEHIDIRQRRNSQTPLSTGIQPQDIP